MVKHAPQHTKVAYLCLGHHERASHVLMRFLSFISNFSSKMTKTSSLFLKTSLLYVWYCNQLSSRWNVLLNLMPMAAFQINSIWRCNFVSWLSWMNCLCITLSSNCGLVYKKVFFVFKGLLHFCLSSSIFFMFLPGRSYFVSFIVSSRNTLGVLNQS